MFSWLLVTKLATQGSLSACSAEQRFAGLNSSIFARSFLASAEMYFQQDRFVLYLPVLTFSRISVSSRPLKGGTPVSRMNRITPHDQMSHFSS